MVFDTRAGGVNIRFAPARARSGRRGRCVLCFVHYACASAGLVHRWDLHSNPGACVAYAAARLDARCHRVARGVPAHHLAPGRALPGRCPCVAVPGAAVPVP